MTASGSSWAAPAAGQVALKLPAAAVAVAAQLEPRRPGCRAPPGVTAGRDIPARDDSPARDARVSPLPEPPSCSPWSAPLPPAPPQRPGSRAGGGAGKLDGGPFYNSNREFQSALEGVLFDRQNQAPRPCHAPAIPWPDHTMLRVSSFRRKDAVTRACASIQHAITSECFV